MILLTFSDRRPPGVGRGRGRGREDGPGGRQPKGVGRGLDDGAKNAGGGRSRGGSGGKTSGGRGKIAEITAAQVCVCVLALRTLCKMGL